MVPPVSNVDRPTGLSGVSLPRGLEAARRLFDRYYLLCMVPVSLLVLVLNYHARGMQGVVPNYEDFKRIILAGFDPKAGIHGTPTFPMWGYGWLLLLTENKATLLVIQNALALLAVWLFIRALERRRDQPSAAIRLLKMLLVISLPWYAFHSLRWPYSVAISLFLVSCVLFVEAVASGKARMGRLLVSGALFGLVLNFRSDFTWMPWMFVATAVAARGGNRRILAEGAAWLATIHLLLLPWALYTKRATGHYLLTSTNAGHVLFIGLGNLPNNRWGITPSDGDPQMRRLVEERWGVAYSSLRYETDRFLRREFWRRVLDDPGEYLRKVAYVFQDMVVGGVYQGEFHETPECQPNCFVKRLRLRERLWVDPAGVLLDLGRQHPRTLALYASALMGRGVVLVSFLLLPLLVGMAWRQRDLLLLLVAEGITYQAAINLFAYHMPTYTANMYFLHLVNLSAGAAWLGRRLLPAKPGLSAAMSEAPDPRGIGSA